MAWRLLCLSFFLTFGCGGSEAVLPVEGDIDTVTGSSDVAAEVAPESDIEPPAAPEDTEEPSEPDNGLPNITVPDVSPPTPSDAGSQGDGPDVSDATEQVEDVVETPVDPNAPVIALFIGNSYTFGGNLTGWVETLAEAEVGGKPIEATQIAKGGAWLQDHLNDAATVTTIQEGGWTHVVLQEQSTLPLLAKGQFLLSVSALNAHIQSGGAELALFETWAREPGHPLYEGDLAGYDFTTMQAALRDAYSTAASANDGLYVPAGDAWEMSLAAHPDIPLYTNDGSHGDTRGVYLTACVFYGALTGETPLGLQAWPDDIEEDVASALQQVAHDILYP